MRRYLIILVLLTIVAPFLASMPNLGPQELAISALAVIGGLAVAIVVGLVYARRRRPALLQAPMREEPDPASLADAIGCFVFAAFFLLPAALALVSTRFRLSMFKWLLGEEGAWLDGFAAVSAGLGLLAWGVAYLLLGVHYRTARFRLLPGAAIVLAVLGWLLLLWAVWERV